MLRSFLQSKSIQTHIFWGMLTVILFVFGTAGTYSYIQAKQIIQKTTDRYANETISQAIGRLETSLKEVDKLTQILSQDTRIQQALTSTTHGNDQLTQVREAVTNLILQSSYIQYAEIYQGKEILYPLQGQSLDQILTGHELEAIDQMKGKLTWIGYKDVFQAQNLPSIMAVTPIEDLRDADRIGYLVVYISPSLINIIMRDFHMSTGSMIDLFDQNGRVLSSTDRNPDEIAKQGIYEMTTASKKGNFVRKVGGNAYYSIYQTLELTNWKLVYQIPDSDLYEPLLNIRRNFIVAAAAGIIMTLLFSVLLAKTISGPVINLVNDMREARRGKRSFTPILTSNLEMNELSRNFHTMMNELNEWIEKVYHAQLLKEQAENRALQAQINPHFLYNTLDTIRWQLILKDEDEVSSMIVDLSKILRYTISKDNGNGHVPLMEEMEQIMRYLSIQKVRFSDKLSISCHLDEDVRHILIPKLLLQPVVENAIIHGIEGIEENGVLEIRGYKDNNICKLEIEDNGAGMTQEQIQAVFDPQRESDHTQGIGLRNVYERIRLTYGPLGDIQIDSTPRQGTRVTLCIPLPIAIDKGA